jgi:hypothetical protein
MSAASSLTTESSLAEQRPLASEPKRRSTISGVAWTGSEGMEYHDWVFEGRRIGAMGRGSPWWVGDWILYGTARWGERYSEAVKITGYDAKSLRNMRYVASRFDLSLRRDTLSWSHHALLAGFEPDERSYWLGRAVADKLSVDDLRLELRAAQRGGYSAAKPGDDSAEGSEQRTHVVCPECGHQFQPPPQQQSESR